MSYAKRLALLTLRASLTGANLENLWRAVMAEGDASQSWARDWNEHGPGSQQERATRTKYAAAMDVLSEVWADSVTIRRLLRESFRELGDPAAARPLPSRVDAAQEHVRHTSAKAADAARAEGEAFEDWRKLAVLGLASDAEETARARWASLAAERAELDMDRDKACQRLSEVLREATGSGLPPKANADQDLADPLRAVANGSQEVIAALRSIGEVSADGARLMEAVQAELAALRAYIELVARKPRGDAARTNAGEKWAATRDGRELLAALFTQTAQDLAPLLAGLELEEASPTGSK